MKRFWIIQNIPSPYRLHIFNVMWEECKARGLDFHVHFMSDMSRGYDERPLSWRNPKMDFPYTYWRDYGIGQRHANPNILYHLWKERPEYLIAGDPFDTLTGMFAARVAHAHVDSTWCEGNTKTPGKMGFPLGWVKRFALKSYKYVAVPGSDAAKYIELHQQRTKSKMPIPVMLPNLVDETRFVPREKWGSEAIHEVRQRIGADENTRVAIIPARLKPVKGLVPFFNNLNAEMLQGWKIMIIGEGELKDELVALAAKRGISDNIVFVPFVSYAEMPRYYAASDLLILPSVYDPNPLSVVEALHSGLPIALTSEAGNVEEGVTDGKNGWVLPVKDPVRYPEVLRKVFAASLSELREKGEYSLANNADFWDSKAAIHALIETLVRADPYQ